MSQNDKILNNSIRLLLKTTMSKKRYSHILGVEYTSLLLNNNKLDNDKVSKIALLHDITKEIEPEKQIKMLQKNGIDPKSIKRVAWHALTSSIYAKDIGIKIDNDIKKATDNHTIPYEIFKNEYSKILFVADFIEPTRDFLIAKKMKKAIKKSTLDDMILLKLRAIKNLTNTKENDYLIKYYERKKNV